jgi:ATP-dependent DNA helicase 2 subunit 2
MASMKTMMMMALDVSPSMCNVVSTDCNVSGCSKLELAKAFMGHFILQRMIASKTVEFGVATFGDNVTSNYLNDTQGGYENVHEIVSMGRPTTDTLSKLHQIRHGDQPGDLIDGVVVAHDTLLRVNAGKAFNRVILLVTDGETAVSGVEDLLVTVEQMRSIKNFAVYIAMMGKTHSGSSVVKQENAKMLRSIAEMVNGKYQEIEQLGESFHLLSAGIGLGTKPTLSKSTLELTPSLVLNVVFWNKISKAKPPSLKKVNSRAGDGDGAVKVDRSYRDPEDPDLEIPHEERVKGFKYGDQYIPVSSADEEKFKISSSPSIQVIGFVAAASVPRYHFLDGPAYIYPALTDSGAHMAMAGFVGSMMTKERVALARLVKRTDADPVLVALLPRTDSCGRACLLMERIPCAEDIRDFSFPSLISFADENKMESNPVLQEQFSAAAQFIQSLTVHEPTYAQLTPVNPSLHRIYAEIHRRILGESPDNMVPVEKGFAAVDSTAAQFARDSLFKAFPLRRSEKKSSDRKKVFWSDIEIKTGGGEPGHRGAQLEIDGQRIAAALSAIELANASAVVDSSSLDELPEFTVGSITPIEDLVARLHALHLLESTTTDDQEKVISESLTVMTKVIHRNITVGASRPHYKRAIECLSTLRQKSIAEKNVEVYNTFMHNTIKAVFSKGRHSSVWQMVVDEKLTLISSNEVETSSVRPSEADQFLKDSFVMEAPTAAVVVVDEEEDLFGNME